MGVQLAASFLAKSATRFLLISESADNLVPWSVAF